MGALATYTVTLGNTSPNLPLGLTAVIFRAPSCYQMNFGLFEQLKASGVISFYGFTNSNEVWLFVPGIEPGQAITFDVNLVQAFEGKCQERPQEAFEYYNPVASQLYSY